MNYLRIADRVKSKFVCELKEDGLFEIKESTNEKSRQMKVRLSFVQKLVNAHDTVFCDRIKSHLDNAERTHDKRLNIVRNWR